MDSIFGGDHGTGGGLQAIGIVNALKTGNVVIDMAIAMCIPVIIKLMFGISGTALSHVGQCCSKVVGRIRPKRCERTIEHTSSDGDGGSDDSVTDTKNMVLIKAIQLYLHFRGDLTLREAGLELSKLPNRSDGDDDGDEGECTSFADTLSTYRIIKRLPANEWIPLGKFGPNREASHYTQRKDGQDPAKENVELIFKSDDETEEQDSKDSYGTARHKRVRTTTITMRLRSGAEYAIDTFVNTALDWYIGELRKLETKTRHLYELNDNFRANNNMNDCRRYKLSDEKTFDTMFFRQKENLLKIVDHFTSKKGKYAIKGYPHKLGLLLHGPPGTGKTSLIKALAHHTGRSVINVPLSKIDTNAQLMSVFFNHGYNVSGIWEDIHLGFKDVIFVMEDIDAVSDVVRRRDGKTDADVTLTEQIDFVPSSLWSMLVRSGDDDVAELVAELKEKSPRLEEEANKTCLQSVAESMNRFPAIFLVPECDGEDQVMSSIVDDALDAAEVTKGQNDRVTAFLSPHVSALKHMLESGADITKEFEDTLLGVSNCGGGAIASATVSRGGGAKGKKSTKNGLLFEMPCGAENFAGGDVENSASLAPVNIGTPSKGGKGGLFKNLMKDRLNLSGLLNVLDGIVDTPERIIVMTTNHPEMLDPALIRPGRIDKKLMLGYMDAGSTCKMLEHFFGKRLNVEETSRVERAIDGDGRSGSIIPNLTPAEIEQLACEYDDTESMISALEKKATPVNPLKREIRRQQSGEDTGG